MGEPSSNQLDCLWAFARGDFSPKSFERWLYENSDIDVFLGEDFHLELISANYQDSSSVWDLRQKIIERLKPREKCECRHIRDLDNIPMGGEGRDERFFASVDRCAERGKQQWWLYLSQCSVCDQFWLVAQEERIYDEYFVARIPKKTGDEVVQGGPWPTRFQTYEDVLALGKELSTPCRFFDDLAMTLVWTVEDLKRERPEITHTRISELLGLPIQHIQRLEKEIT